jgi:hypothetical protein
MLLTVVQLSLAAAMARRGKAPGWIVRASTGILAGEMIEAVCGHYHLFWLHVPLGVAIFGGFLRQLLWVVNQ